MYCNHCQPCPMGLDVGLINKYYDLSKAGDILARDHYNNLEKTAGDCVSCGHCDSRCPFHVAQSQRMEEIREYLESKTAFPYRGSRIWLSLFHVLLFIGVGGMKNPCRGRFLWRTKGVAIFFL